MASPAEEREKRRVRKQAIMMYKTALSTNNNIMVVHIREDYPELLSTFNMLDEVYNG